MKLNFRQMAMIELGYNRMMASLVRGFV